MPVLIIGSSIDEKLSKEEQKELIKSNDAGNQIKEMEVNLLF